MDPQRWQRIRALFEGALAIEEAARLAWLDAQCAGDAELRHEVDALLHADAKADTLAVAAVAPDLVEEIATSERAGQARQLTGRRLGPWRLVREIGRGGMGAVWLAERDDGEYAQQAAVKLVNPGWDAGELLRRFRAERQILAGLNHPNIARLLDGGVSEDGKPYLVLEYVDGASIGEHCDLARLPLTARLKLFLDVCAAVAHAHRSLVVHRDLKPSNILVDRDGRVKLLDFGIAKLIEPGADAGVSMLRAFTPEYAAPEQVRGEPATTGVDVYALGLLLYQLLTGRRPYAQTASTPAAYEQAILTQEPERPSRAAAQSDPAAIERARMRDLDPSRLAARLRGDLDAIVMKALRKDPAERYDSVAALADDVERFLDHRPVAARRGNWRYRARRFLQRHALSTALATLALLALVGGLGAALWQADIARQQRDAAERAGHEARAVSEFLTRVFAEADPANTDGRDPRASELLRAGVEQIAQATDLAPATRSAMYYALGEAQLARGDYTAGQALMERALEEAGEDGYARMRALLGVGVALNQQGRFDASWARYDEARAWQARHPGLDRALSDQLEYLSAVNLMNRNRKDEAAVRLGALVEDFQRRGDMLGDAAVQAHGMYAYLLGAMKRTDQALAVSGALYRAAKTQPGLPLTRLATIVGAHAYALMSAQKLVEAEPLFREALAINQRIYGIGHLGTVVSLNNIAICLGRQGRHAESAALLEQAIAIRREKLPKDHPDLGHSLNNAGSAYEKAGDSATALQRFTEAVELWRRAGTKPAQWTLRAMHGRARMLEQLGRGDEALAMARELQPLTDGNAEYQGQAGVDLRALIERLQNPTQR
ncbi:MAG: serine/threonine protein kinase [Rhodanobacteraceae bacterium]|nr:serine/threonine protein kinase [Rhodanobacteraceae bacterium]